MNTPSKEHVSAFVDSELSKQEVADMLEAMSEDKQLAEAACELRNLKLMVRHAYEDTMESKPSSPHPWRGHASRAIAATLILGLGSLAGWKIHESITPDNWMVASPGLPKDIHPVSLAVALRTDRFVLHIDSNNPDQVRSALDRASTLLSKGQSSRQDVHIEIIANNHGLDMLRQDRSRVADRINQLSDAYPDNLKFVACGQSVKRFEQEGQHVKLLPQVQVASSAIDEIVTHLKEGWTYIKV